MAHRLLQPPGGTLRYKLRLPVVQPITETIADNLLDTLMDRDSLRRTKTSGTHVVKAPLAQLQHFALTHVGFTNSDESMIAGLRQSNARKLVDKSRGQGFGP